jgi:hypothetical protein
MITSQEVSMRNNAILARSFGSLSFLAWSTITMKVSQVGSTAATSALLYSRRADMAQTPS